MAEEELMVVLRKSEDATFGFSLLRTEVFPHVIYDIVENSPAAECGENDVVDERSEVAIAPTLGGTWLGAEKFRNIL
ncbi:hypothetical protein quinque_014988 [Culex quinquefasciatus]